MRLLSYWLSILHILRVRLWVVQKGSRLWGVSVGIAMLVVALISPFLGAIADFTAAKKKFLLGFTLVSCGFTAFLFFVREGDVFTGMLFFILAEIGYRGAQVFYNSLLPEIASEDDIGRVSGIGWAIGSAGGVLCLFIILPLILIIQGTFYGPFVAGHHGMFTSLCHQFLSFCI